MIGTNKQNAEFRKEHTVYIFSDSYLDKGVIKPGIKLKTSAFFSVQSVKNAESVEGLAEGRRLSDWRRLYSDVKLPMVGDEVRVYEPGVISSGSGVLSTASGSVIQVGVSVGENGMTAPATVVIDGFEYTVQHRESWQNGVISHYKYFVVRKQYAA